MPGVESGTYGIHLCSLRAKCRRRNNSHPSPGHTATNGDPTFRASWNLYLSLVYHAIFLINQERKFYATITFIQYFRYLLSWKYVPRMNFMLWWLETHMTAETRSSRSRGGDTHSSFSPTNVTFSSSSRGTVPHPQGLPRNTLPLKHTSYSTSQLFPFWSITQVHISQKQRPLRFTFLVIVRCPLNICGNE